jgi:hypothetical protein
MRRTLLAVLRHAQRLACAGLLGLALVSAAQAQSCSPYKGQVTINEVRIGASNKTDAKNQIEIYNSGNVAPAVWQTWQFIVYYKDGSKLAVKKGGYYLSSGVTANGQFIYNNTLKTFLKNKNNSAVDIALVDATGAFIDYVALEAQIQTVPACMGTVAVGNVTSSKDKSGDFARIPDGGSWPAGVATTSIHTIGRTNGCSAGGDLIISNEVDYAKPVQASTTLTYTVTAYNNACSASVSGTEVTITNLSTANFSSRTTAVSGGCGSASGTGSIVWNIGTLNAGAACTLTFTGKAINLGTVTSVATATKPTSGLINTGDDSDTVSITAYQYNFVGFEVATDTATEGTDTSFSAYVAINVPSTKTVTVNYTVSGTAGAGDHNAGTSGSVVIAANADSDSIDFTIANDAVYEATKTIVLTITSVTSTDALVKIGTVPTGDVLTETVTLYDDDPLSVDHYELSAPGNALACAASTLTVTACANASSPCTSAATSVNGQTATLAASAGALGATTVTFNSAGVASTSLSHPGAGDGSTTAVTLAGESIGAANPRKCCTNGSSCSVANSCPVTYNTAGFMVSASANGAAVALPSQTAGTASGTYYLRAVQTSTTTKACEAALTGSTTVNWAYQCNNPATCSVGNLMTLTGNGATTIAGNPNTAISSFTAVPMSFDANGNAPFSFNYADVGQLTLAASKGAGGSLLSALAGSSNAFVVKPAGFALSNIRQTASPNLVNPAAAGAGGARFVKAGESFSATVTAQTSGGATTPSYGRETSPEGVLLTHALVLPAGGASGTLANGSVAGGSFTGGVATVSNLSWSEVGIITLTPSVADGDYLGAGSVSGSSTGNVGRFIPDRFSITAGTPAPACSGAFSYFGQDGFSTPFTLKAENTAGATTQNYSGSFALLGLTSWSNFVFSAAGLPAGAALGASASAPSGSWSAGVASVLARHQVSRPTALTGETSVIVRAAPLDADGVTMPAAPLGAATPLRFGRLRLSNVFGSEKGALQVPVQTQYWSGNSWVQNSADSCTSIPAAAVVRAAYLDNKGAVAGGWTSSVSAISIAGGNGSLTLGAPSPAATGSVEIALNLGTTATDQSCLAAHPSSTGAALPWLRSQYGSGGACAALWDRDPSARASFGIYVPETRKTVHVRELF